MIASNETFVFAAYAITWLALLGYVWRLSRQERRARAGQTDAGGRRGEGRA